jgi:hypothetical protein
LNWEKRREIEGLKIFEALMIEGTWRVGKGLDGVLRNVLRVKRHLS